MKVPKKEIKTGYLFLVIGLMICLIGWCILFDQEFGIEWLGAAFPLILFTLLIVFTLISRVSEKRPPNWRPNRMTVRGETIRTENLNKAVPTRHSVYALIALAMIPGSLIIVILLAALGLL